jgi:hypothetical protein
MSKVNHIKSITYKFYGTIISLFVMVFVTCFPKADDGLEMLFLLPAALALGSALLGDVFRYWKDSVGLLILYGLICVRYLITPMLIAVSGNTVALVNPSKEGYLFALIMMVVELFVVLISISLVWKPIVGLDEDICKKQEFRLTWVGVFAVMSLVALLIFRGNLPNVFSHFTSFLRYSTSQLDLFTFDMIGVLILKAFIFIAIVVWASKHYKRSESVINKFFFAAIGIIIAIGNIIFYDHQARAMLAEIIVGTAATLIYCYPKLKKIIILFFSTGAIILVGSAFMTGTLFFNLGEVSLSNTNNMNRLSEVAELYSNNVSMMAFAYDQYSNISNQMSILTYFSDLINNLGFITIPGFRIIYYIFLNVPTTASFFMASLAGAGYILPMAGQTLYYGGISFGWLLDIIAFIICIRLMYYFHKKGKRSNNAGYIYVLAYCEVICSLTLINNFGIMLNTLTGIPLLLYLFLKLNEIGKKVLIKRS